MTLYTNIALSLWRRESSLRLVSPGRSGEFRPVVQVSFTGSSRCDSHGRPGGFHLVVTWLSRCKGLIIAPDATQLNSTQLNSTGSFNWQLSWVESGRASDHTESGAMITLPTRLNSTDELQRVFHQSPSSEIFRIRQLSLVESGRALWSRQNWVVTSVQNKECTSLGKFPADTI